MAPLLDVGIRVTSKTSKKPISSLHVRRIILNRQLFHFYPIFSGRRLSASPLWENLGLDCLRDPIQE